MRWHRRRHAARRSASFPSPTTAPSSGPAGHLLPREKGKNWHPRTPAGEGNALAPAEARGQTQRVFPFSHDRALIRPCGPPSPEGEGKELAPADSRGRREGTGTGGCTPARCGASFPSPTTAPSSGPAGHLLPREKGMHWHPRTPAGEGNALAPADARGQTRPVFSLSHDCALIRPCGPPSPAGEGKALAPADSRGRRECTGTGGCTSARCSASFPSPTSAPSSGPAGHLLPREKGKNWHPRTPAGEGNALAPADARGQTRPVFPFSRRMRPGQAQRVFPLSRRERGRGEGVRSARFHEKSTVAPGAHDLRRIRGAAGRGTVRARPANHVRVARSLPSA